MYFSTSFITDCFNLVLYGEKEWKCNTVSLKKSCFIFIKQDAWSKGIETEFICPINDIAVFLSGLVVMCSPLDPRFMGSNLAEVDGFLRVIKIHSTTSLRREVKPGVPCHTFVA
jgi:hypothetical protein